jgi:hypothetical protein
MAVAVAVGTIISCLLFALALGVRPDFLSAIGTWHFVLKVAVAAVFLASACWACVRLAHPQARLRDVLLGLAIAPALLATAVGYELMTLPAGQWYADAIGTNSLLCLAAVPLLSVPPLATMLVALRAGAPSSAAQTGAVIGLLAGGVGSTLYSIHCIDDSPLFVAIWYTLGVALLAFVGAGLGSRILRW